MENSEHFHLKGELGDKEGMEGAKVRKWWGVGLPGGVIVRIGQSPRGIMVKQGGFSLLKKEERARSCFLTGIGTTLKGNREVELFFWKGWSRVKKGLYDQAGYIGQCIQDF